MYHYRIKYSGKRRGSPFRDTLVISSPYNLNDSYADAAFVINQIRYELGRKSRDFMIHQIEITQPPEIGQELVSAGSGSASH